MSALPPIFVEFMASSAGFRAASKEVQGEIRKVETTGGGTFSKVAAGGTKAFALIGAAAAVAAVKSVAMAGDWQQSITRLGTAAGEAKSNLGMISSGLLQIARDTGTSTHEIAAGMYMVESAGYHGADGLKVMRAAAEGAKVENADLGSVSNALTTVMKDLHAPVGSVATIMSQMVTTVGQGKMTMDDLAGSIHSVLPNAAQLGISFPQVAGALATMTAQGIRADQAAQNLNHTIVKLGAPTIGMTKTMALYGLQSATVRDQLGSKGLTGTFEELSTAIMQKMGPAGTTLLNSYNTSKAAASDLKLMLGNLHGQLHDEAVAFLNGSESLKTFTGGIRATGGQQAILGAQFLSLYKAQGGFNDLLKSGVPAAQSYTAAMKGMLGDQTGLAVALHLTGKATVDFNDNVKQIGGVSQEAGGHVRDWSTVQKNFNLQMAKLREVVQTAMIEIGLKLMPVVQAIVGWFSKHIEVAKDVVIGLVALAAAFGVVRLGMALGRGIMTLYNAAMVVGRTVALAYGSAQKIAAAVLDGTALSMARSTVALAAQKVASIAASVASKAMAAAQWLLNAAMDANPVALFVTVLAALALGLVYAYNHSKTFRDIISDIGSVFAWVWHHILEPVVDFFTKHWRGALEIAVAVVAPFVALPLLIVTHWRQILDFFGKLPGLIWGYLKDAGSWLLRIGSNIMTGLWNGIVSVWNTTVAWFRNFGSMVWGFFSQAGSWLFNVGEAIFTGLWNGIKSVWNNMTSWLGSVGSWISNLKGPIEKDAVLLVPHGKAIMNGLHTGLKAGWQDVRSGLQGMTTELGGMQFGVPSAGGFGLAGGGGSVVNISVNVQGNVTSEQELVRALQTEMLKLGMRRGQTWQSYKR